MSFRLLAGFAALLALTAAIAFSAGRGSLHLGLSSAAGSPPGPPAAVRERLARGLNLSFWFTYRNDAGIDPRLWQPDSEDLRRIRAMGFRHVRIPVDQGWLADPKNPAMPETTHLAELRRALDELAADDLLSVIALDGQAEWKTRLASDPAALDTTAALWKNLAGALATLPPDRLVFEALNEPATDDTQTSQRIMQRLHDAIREVAPSHTIVVAGPKFSSVPELLLLTPLADPNVVYTFHFYEPFNFTHQGATWGWPMWAKFRGWPYPSSEAAVAPLLDAAPADVMPHLRFYGQQNWSRDKLAAPLDQATDWAKAHGVLLWCGEFGAMKTYAPPGSREAWLRDARELMEARGIYWAHFDYLNHFGIAGGQQGAREYDAGALAALGLKPP